MIMIVIALGKTVVVGDPGMGLKVSLMVYAKGR